MSNKQKRLQEVYEHLRRWYDIHTQTDLANSLRYSRNSITLALNGNEKYLTDKLFQNICEVFPGVFNLDYLLTGNGKLLLDRQEPEPETQQPIDHSSLINALLASKDETIASHERTIAALERQIATDQNLIASLQQQIEHLSHFMGHPQLDDYPFTMGVADNSNPNPDQV